MIRFVASMLPGSPELPAFAQKLRWRDHRWEQLPVLVRIDHLEAFEGFADGLESAWMISQGWHMGGAAEAVGPSLAVEPLRDSIRAGHALALHRHMFLSRMARHVAAPSPLLLTGEPLIVGGRSLGNPDRSALLSLVPDIFWLVYEVVPGQSGPA